VLPKWGSEIPILSSLWHSMEVFTPARDNGNGSARKGEVFTPGTGLRAQREAKSRTERGDKIQKVVHRVRRKRKQLLALVITERPKALADRVLKELNRGVTGLHGRGMYTQQEREVLLIAVTVMEMKHLKSVVKAEDPRAFIIITPAQDVIGQGFQTLDG